MFSSSSGSGTSVTPAGTAVRPAPPGGPASGAAQMLFPISLTDRQRHTKQLCCYLRNRLVRRGTEVSQQRHHHTQACNDSQARTKHSRSAGPSDFAIDFTEVAQNCSPAPTSPVYELSPAAPSNCDNTDSKPSSSRCQGCRSLKRRPRRRLPEKNLPPAEEATQPEPRQHIAIAK